MISHIERDDLHTGDEIDAAIIDASIQYGGKWTALVRSDRVVLIRVNPQPDTWLRIAYKGEIVDKGRTTNDTT